MDATFCTFGGAAAELRRCATKAQLIARHASVEVRPLVTKKDKTRCCILLHLAKPDAPAIAPRSLCYLVLRPWRSLANPLFPSSPPPPPLRDSQLLTLVTSVGSATPALRSVVVTHAQRARIVGHGATILHCRAEISCPGARARGWSAIGSKPRGVPPAAQALFLRRQLVSRSSARSSASPGRSPDYVRLRQMPLN
jgi:hypothetical protein